MSGLNTFFNYRSSHHTKATAAAIQAQTTYVQQRDRDQWLETHPGRPFPESMLTASEQRYAAKIRRLNTIGRQQLNRILLIQWVVVGGVGLLFALSGAGAVVTVIGLACMGWHHFADTQLWNELHRTLTPAPKAIDATEAERIVRHWQPPYVPDAPTVVIPVVQNSRGRHCA